MSARLFVTKLPFKATENDLREHFSQVGPVTAVILPTDRETGKRRGFAFVDFEDKATAEEAIRRFNNGLFQGHMISVSEARPREQRRPGLHSGQSHSGGFAGRSSGGGFRRGPSQNGEVRGSPDEDRPSRRAQRTGKSGGRKDAGPKTPRGPIPERRSGRFHDLGDDDQNATDVEFENLATSAPPGDDDLGG